MLFYREMLYRGKRYVVLAALEDVEDAETPSFSYLWAQYEKIQDEWFAASDWADAEDFEELVTQAVEERYDLDRDDPEFSDAFQLYVDEAEEDVAWEYARAAFKTRYDAIVEDLDSLDGHECWRTMLLPADVDPAALEKLGRYWSIEDTGTGAYFHHLAPRGETQQVQYRARVDAKYIDRLGTVAARLHPHHGDTEMEVRFLSDSPIHVFDVTIDDPYSGGYLDKIEINGWRRT